MSLDQMEFLSWLASSKWGSFGGCSRVCKLCKYHDGKDTPRHTKLESLYWCGDWTQPSPLLLVLRYRTLATTICCPSACNHLCEHMLHMLTLIMRLLADLFGCSPVATMTWTSCWSTTCPLSREAEGTSPAMASRVAASSAVAAPGRSACPHKW